MKVAVIFLNYSRLQHTEQVKRVNLNNAGYPFSLIEIDQLGIAKAINEGIKQSAGHDAVVTMANDILMPNDWLAQMVHHASTIEKTGMCGIHTVEGEGELTEYNGLKVYDSFTAFGNVLIPMNVIDRIGYFNTDFDPYSFQDADYAIRLRGAGLVNYYIAGMKAQHVGHDVGDGSEYRKMKDTGMTENAGKHEKWLPYYLNNNYYLPYEQSNLEANTIL